MADTKHVTIRMPSDVYEELKRIAEQEDRSMNAQLIRTLRQVWGLTTNSKDRDDDHPQAATA